MGWVMRDGLDISWEHCGRPAYWQGEEVICSKCQTILNETEEETTDEPCS